MFGVGDGHEDVGKVAPYRDTAPILRDDADDNRGSRRDVLRYLGSCVD